MDARTALIEVLSAELDLDSTEDFAAAVDTILIKVAIPPRHECRGFSRRIR